MHFSFWRGKYPGLYELLIFDIRKDFVPAAPAVSFSGRSCYVLAYAGMRYLLFVLLLFYKVVSPQSTFTALKPDQALPVLEGRAYLLFPARSAAVRYKTDSLNTEWKTIITVDSSGYQLIFLAEELYAFAGDNLLTGVRARQGKGFFVRTLKRTDSQVAVLSTPLTFDSTKSRILVNSLIVRTPDKTVFRINAFVNPKAFRLKEAYGALSERVFQDLRKEHGL